MAQQLPNIDDYALVCMRHPHFEAGYQQWLKVVSAWGYDINEVYEEDWPILGITKGQSVWTHTEYKALWVQ